MFWTLIIFVGLATAFVKLGAYSVWMTIFSDGLKLALAVIVLMLFWMIIRSVFPRQR